MIQESDPIHVMVVEDEPPVQTLLKYLLEREGYRVSTAENGREALDQLGELAPDLFVVDVMMPEMDGITFCKHLRERTPSRNTPILMLTAKTQMVTKYEAFETGVHDFMTKPFDSLELVFRVRSLLSHARRPADGPAGLTLDAPAYVALVDGREVPLTKLETAMLAYLMANRGRVLSARRLADDVLGGDKGGSARSVDAVHAHIRHLRAKLEVTPEQPRWIITDGRKGYTYRG